MFVLLAGWRGGDQVRDDLCQIAVVLRPILVDRVLDVSSVVR